MIILNLEQQNILQLKGVKIWAQRLSYVGELGYELYVDLKMLKKYTNYL
jgi:glycine cleavage system aminomethyltransferase T